MGRFLFPVDLPCRGRIGAPPTLPRQRLVAVLVTGLVLLSGRALPAEELPATNPPTGTARKLDADADDAASRRLDIPPKLATILAKEYPESVADLRAIQDQTARVLGQVMPATVGLQINSSSGSGVIVRSDGLILTAGHVAGRPGRGVSVLLADGRQARGQTLGTNHAVDSGMIQITDEGPWPFAPLAEAGDIRPGQWVVATGHPGGYRRDRSAPVRLGRVLFLNEDVICTDCTLVGGDSGGPLFNMRGEVVAIHSRIGRHITSNFHVPIAAYLTTWDRLTAGQMWGGQPPEDEHGTRVRPFLGIHLDGRQVRPTVAQVDPSTPAARAGIQIGDVVLAFDGQPVPTQAELTEQLLRKRPNQRVRVRLERDGKPVEIEMTLGAASLKLPGGPADEPPRKEKEKKAPPGRGSPRDERPPAPDDAPKETPPKPTPPKDRPKEGPAEEEPPDGSPPDAHPPPKSPPNDEKSAVPPTAADADPLLTTLGIETDRVSRRCIVARVLRGSPAASADIRPGDIITRFGDQTVRNPADLRNAVAGRADANVEIGLLRGGREVVRAVRRDEN